MWHAVGTVTRQQLEQRRGVRLESFGSFAFDKIGTPCFVVAPDFSKKFAVSQKATAVLDSSVVQRLNLSQLGDESGIDRGNAEKIFKSFIATIGNAIQAGRKVLVVVHKVAEIFIADNAIRSTFMPEFLREMGLQPVVSTPSKTLARPQSARRPPRAPVPAWKEIDPVSRADANGKPLPGQTVSSSSFKKSKKTKQLVPGKKPGPSAPYKNPITGEGADDAAPQRRKRVDNFTSDRNPILQNEDEDEEYDSRIEDRRPNSASSYGSVPRSVGSGSIRDSPRSGWGGTPRTIPARPSSAGPVKTTTAGIASKLSLAVPDPRKLAAAAIGPGDIINRIRQKIVERGGSNGIRSLGKLLAIMDNSGDKRLSRDELMYGLRDYGISLTPTELEQVFFAFDRDRNGSVDIDEFLIAMKGDLNDRRRRLVNLAFDILDRDKSGFVTIDDLVDVYDVTSNPAFKAGKITKQQAYEEFLSQWDRLEKDGMVTRDEFEDYYKDISSSIDGDDYFELMIRNAWRIAGGVGMAANTANRRVLVTNKDGSQSVVGINNELGVRAGDKDMMRARLAQQGVNGANIDLYGGLDTTEKAKKVCRISSCIYEAFLN